jgi:PEP-CTERM motif-containing protein
MKKLILTLFMLTGLNFSANAAHIDQLGIDISLNSSDGMGNFSVLYREYFGSDGWMWENDNPGLWDTTPARNGPLTVTSFLAAGPGILSNPGNFTVLFDGLVDMMGVNTPGFGSGQISTQFVNDLSDAALYSTILNFTITGFDNTMSYLVDITANDCCYVSGGGGPSFSGQLRFDPTQVVNPVPEPSTLIIMLIGVFALAGRRYRK